ncbi:MAG TPA: division/cell wall cluster transcriptional repressor MraZ [Acidimicrobiales bacterium]|nr:division/cell wall cluster transcriptional repressor MraZ [Acidimicrobiales bacterium]
MFFGRYEHSLDAKGRVVLPARFRSSFDSQAYLTQYLDGCLALWTPEEFGRRLAEYSQAQARSSADRNLARVWAAGSQEVEIDRQGRLALPQHLKEFAQLDRNVLVVGAMERIELWDPTQWEARVRPAELNLTDPVDVASAPLDDSGS